MKIVGISGSPSKDGENDQAIDIALEIAKQKGFDVEKISLAEIQIKPCTSCYRCIDTEDCPENEEDDMPLVYDLLKEADAILISSPAYFGSMSAQLKALVDRTYLLAKNGQLLKNKVGAAIAIAGSRNGGQELTIQGIHAWMKIMGMVVVSDGYNTGGILVKPIEKDEIGIKTIKGVVTRICETLDRLNGKKEDSEE
ncbi:flavodoxin family protein [Nanoarchaeota archaeon]